MEADWQVQGPPDRVSGDRQSLRQSVRTGKVPLPGRRAAAGKRDQTLLHPRHIRRGRRAVHSRSVPQRDGPTPRRRPQRQVQARGKQVERMARQRQTGPARNDARRKRSHCLGLRFATRPKREVQPLGQSRLSGKGPSLPRRFSVVWRGHVDLPRLLRRADALLGPHRAAQVRRNGGRHVQGRAQMARRFRRRRIRRLRNQIRRRRALGTRPGPRMGTRPADKRPGRGRRRGDRLRRLPDHMRPGRADVLRERKETLAELHARRLRNVPVLRDHGRRSELGLHHGDNLAQGPGRDVRLPHPGAHRRAARAFRKRDPGRRRHDGRIRRQTGRIRLRNP